MGDQNPVAFNSEGSINPQWTQFINDRDALTSEIGAYFLSGESLKLDVNCLAKECVLKSRTCKFDNKETKKVELNPMMLCFFCNRTYHAACYDLDSHLIKKEKVPWKCNDCRKDLLNKHCQAYYEQTKYMDSLLVRRAKLLLPSCLPESEEDLSGEIEFCTSDLKSFEIRAVTILAEEDPESVADITAITPLVLKEVMKSRSDKRASIESADRYRLELELKVKELEQLKLSIAKIQNGKQGTSHDESNVNMSINESPSFSAVHSSQMQQIGRDRASNSLIGHYLGQDRLSELEASTYQYRPQAIPRRDKSTAMEVTQTNDSQQLTVDQSDLTTLVARLAIQNDKKEERKLLEDRRKAMPKMIEFSGEESKWLIFKRDVERYRQNCQYDEETVKTYMRGALKGEAYLIVRDILEDSPIDDIMEHLKRAFGDEMRMVRNRSEELRNFKFGPILNRTEAVKLQVAIQSYFAACNYAKIGYINTNIIAEAIFHQFSIEDRQRCREYYERKSPGCTTIVMNVQTIYDYLMSRMPLLDDVPVKKKFNEFESKSIERSFQMHSTNLTIESNEDYKFQIKDRNKAIYIGYDLDMVDRLSKECAICKGSDHFTVECPQYKEKDESDRLRIVFNKKLCKNCILTTSHQAKDCKMKVSCGFKLDRTSRCCAKHHISIHHADLDMLQSIRDRDSSKKYSDERDKSTTSDTSSNSASSDSSSDEEETKSTAIAPETTASTSAAFIASDSSSTERTYDLVEIGCTSNADSPKTVKVFRVKLWGPKGYVTALAIGDSGSEVTLMRDDLRRKLELNGVPHNLHLQWADKTKKTCNAMQFDIQIQGINEGASKINLKDCFAWTDLNLPKRTLDMEKLRENFPNLKKIPFEGYYDEDPVMLIGSPHANLIEGCELVENGESGPVALRTRIGWTVYGGSNHTIDSISTTQEVSDELEINKRFSQIDALKNVKENKIAINCGDNDKKLNKRKLNLQFCPPPPRKSRALLPSTNDKVDFVPKSQIDEHVWKFNDGNRKNFELKFKSRRKIYKNAWIYRKKRRSTCAKAVLGHESDGNSQDDDSEAATTRQLSETNSLQIGKVISDTPMPTRSELIEVRCSSNEANSCHIYKHRDTTDNNNHESLGVGKHIGSIGNYGLLRVAGLVRAHVTQTIRLQNLLVRNYGPEIRKLKEVNRKWEHIGLNHHPIAGITTFQSASPQNVAK